MITKKQALTANEFHYGECKRTFGPRGGITEYVERWRRNGKTQTWKRDPERFRIPIKFGLYAYSAIHNESSDATQWHTSEDCPLNKTHEGAGANPNVGIAF